MNYLQTTVHVLMLGLAIGSAVCLARAAQYPAHGSQRNAQPADTPYQVREPWYEFALRQFNPEDIDYGHWIEQKRHAFIDAHIRNSYFLYSLTTSVGLSLATILYMKLWIDHRRTLWITAEMMTDIYNQDAYSRRIAKDAIDKYNSHIERCNRAIEAAELGEAAPPASAEIDQLRNELMRVAEERDAATRDRDLAREELRRKSEILAEMSVRLEAVANKSTRASTRKPGPDVRSADPKLVSHINNLQEQLYAERNHNRKLKG